MMNTSLQRILGRVIFLLGVILGFVLAVIALWNRVEATNYFFSGAKYEQFRGLHCPLMIAPSEPGVVSAVFSNPTGEDVTFFYRTQIGETRSTGSLPEEIAVPPGQSRSVQLTVDANDVDLGFFIFVKINVLPNPVRRAQEGLCGIMVANILGLRGGQVSAAILILSFLGMAVGLGLRPFPQSDEENNLERIMQVLGFVVILSMLAGVLGWWLPGMALAAIAILLMAIFVRIAIG